MFQVPQQRRRSTWTLCRGSPDKLNWAPGVAPKMSVRNQRNYSSSQFTPDRAIFSRAKALIYYILYTLRRVAIPIMEQDYGRGAPKVAVAATPMNIAHAFLLSDEMTFRPLALRVLYVLLDKYVSPMRQRASVHGKFTVCARQERERRRQREHEQRRRRRRRASQSQYSPDATRRDTSVAKPSSHALMR